VIARIDDRDYRTALDQAEAQVAAAHASIENMTRSSMCSRHRSAPPGTGGSGAGRAWLFAEQQAARYEHLGQTGYAPFRTNSNIPRSSTEAGPRSRAHRRPEAGAAASRSAEGSAQQRRREPRPGSGQRDQAQLILSLHDGDGAQPGRVVNLTSRGRSIRPARHEPYDVVPDQIWVTANFKEIQLDHMRPGDPRRSRSTPSGTQNPQSCRERAAGSGTRSRCFRPRTTTGNYVKIVQRVPGEIIMDNPPADVALGPGHVGRPDRARRLHLVAD